ncbi:hypothetical protein ACFO25_15445 [Paenactinomyces guangxiensis]|uniref:Uncharacterized protein n=1 Tax=Paenactinomyces guangxiensis TaxID=1490290 RepID=A0A7W1WT48_9BACL|nr:hypothetical protein [Paenactinomyces guangxiensis]MBA4495570.1 hypothetical protein [Paenactinomyces guangxiensis]MBH8592828.1 hypothetical protein [Paenactinomyces guangxiensis]
MERDKTINYVSESQLISYVVYVMAKLGYSRKNIAELVRELNTTFDLKYDDFTFNTSLAVGEEDRKNLLPTISRRNDETRQ